MQRCTDCRRCEDLQSLSNSIQKGSQGKCLSDRPEMPIALICLEKGQKLEPSRAPLRLLMYVAEGKGTFTVGEKKIEAD